MGTTAQSSSKPCKKLLSLSDIIKLFSRKGRKFYFFIARTAGYLPTSTSHFQDAFTHRSFSNPVQSHEGDTNNERLEFLGDAVIGTVVAHVLYKKMPTADEGLMSRLRANIVSRKRLNAVALNLGMGEFIKSNNLRSLSSTHIPGDALEAFVAAIFLDSGLRRATRFVRKHIASDAIIAEVLEEAEPSNYKSILLEAGQHAKVLISFDTSQLDDANTLTSVNFKTVVLANGKPISEAGGHSKKKAEREAAKMALSLIEAGSLDLATFAHETADATSSEPDSRQTSKQDVQQEL